MGKGGKRVKGGGWKAAYAGWREERRMEGEERAMRPWCMDARSTVMVEVRGPATLGSSMRKEFSIFVPVEAVKTMVEDRGGAKTFGFACYVKAEQGKMEKVEYRTGLREVLKPNQESLVLYTRLTWKHYG